MNQIIVLGSFSAERYSYVNLIVSAWVCWVFCEGTWNGTSRIVFVEVRKYDRGSGLAGGNRRD